MNTGLLEQLRIYGDDFDAGLPPVTLDELVAEGSGPQRVQPLPRRVDRPVPGWVYTAAATVAVLVLVGGTAWLVRVTGSDTPVADTIVPTTLTATETAAQGEDAAVSVTGHLLDTKYWELPIGAPLDARIVMSDERLSGDVTFTAKGEVFESLDPGDDDQHLYWGTMLIENDGGTWEGTHFAADHHSQPGVHGPIVMQLVGSGDYEGLSAILYRTVISDRDVPQRDLEESVDGMIFPGDLPANRS